MPLGYLPGLEKRVIGRAFVVLRCGEPAQIKVVEFVQHPVVEEDVRAVKSRNHHVLVVARVAQQRAVGAIAVGHAWDVLVHSARADLQLRSDRAIPVLHVQIGTDPWAAAEHRIEIEGRRPRIRRRQRILQHP